MSEPMLSDPVHFIANLSVNDPDEYRVYEKGFFPILKAHGGQFVTYDDDVTVLDGDHRGRTVIIRFESEESCLAWWNSPEYRELAQHREASSSTHSIVIVHPLPAR